MTQHHVTSCNIPISSSNLRNFITILSRPHWNQPIAKGWSRHLRNRECSDTAKGQRENAVAWQRICELLRIALIDSYNIGSISQNDAKCRFKWLWDWNGLKIIATHAPMPELQTMAKPTSSFFLFQFWIWTLVEGLHCCVLLCFAKQLVQDKTLCLQTWGGGFSTRGGSVQSDMLDVVGTVSSMYHLYISFSFAGMFGIVCSMCLLGFYLVGNDSWRCFFSPVRMVVERFTFREAYSTKCSGMLILRLGLFFVLIVTQIHGRNV